MRLRFLQSYPKSVKEDMVWAIYNAVDQIIWFVFDTSKNYFEVEIAGFGLAPKLAVCVSENKNLESLYD
jgi:hypothetical protein